MSTPSDLVSKLTNDFAKSKGISPEQAQMLIFSAGLKKLSETGGKNPDVIKSQMEMQQQLNAMSQTMEAIGNSVKATGAGMSTATRKI